jgi:hypothetical protein
MDALQPLRIASTAPGMVWLIRAYSPPDKPHFVRAFEVSSDSKDCEWGSAGCRQFRVYVPGGRVHSRNVAKATRSLLLKMNAAGAIAPNHKAV